MNLDFDLGFGFLLDVQRIDLDRYWRIEDVDLEWLEDLGLGMEDELGLDAEVVAVKDWIRGKRDKKEGFGRGWLGDGEER